MTVKLIIKNKNKNREQVDLVENNERRRVSVTASIKQFSFTVNHMNVLMGGKTKIKTIWHLNIWLIFFVARMRLSTKLLFLQVLFFLKCLFNDYIQILGRSVCVPRRNVSMKPAGGFSESS